MRLLLLATACVLMPVLAHAAETKTFEGTGLEELVLQNSAGEVRIDGTDEGNAVVTAHKIAFVRNKRGRYPFFETSESASSHPRSGVRHTGRGGSRGTDPTEKRVASPF